MTWQEQLWHAVRPAVTTASRYPTAVDVVMPRSVLDRDWHPFLDIICDAHGWAWRCIYPGCRVVIEDAAGVVCEIVVRPEGGAR